MNLWPDHETNIDLLGFSYIADAVANLASADHLLPATIGVFGDWVFFASTFSLFLQTPSAAATQGNLRVIFH